MAAMKPRTGDGPMEVTKEGRGVVVRIPLEGGGRLVVEMSFDEAKELDTQLEVFKRLRLLLFRGDKSLPASHLRLLLILK
jgi:Protein of unknown function (DUF3117).